MGTTTKLTFQDWQRLPEREGTIYELDEGELLMEPSPALRHNLIRQRIATRLREYVESGRLGLVVEEMDFRLGPDTVRNPDVAFMTQEHLSQTDIDRSPVEGAPVLAVEVVSPTNRAEDMVKKTRQYLEAGARSVWIVYPKVRLSEIHSTKNVRTVQEPETLRDDALLPNLSMSLPYIFDGAQDRS
jgi:Uma2 family endonuclease